MPNGQKDIMAQGVYLAMIEAVKSNCKCRTCQILRKAQARMADDFLADKPVIPPIVDPSGTGGTPVIEED